MKLRGKVMKKFLVVICTLLLILFYISSVSATYMADITYDYEDHGLGNYTFIFNVNNTSDGVSDGPLDFFMIDFDADSDFSLYSNLTWVEDNNWYSETYEYDPSFGGLPGISFADDSIFGSGGLGIAQGDSLGGFSVNFDYFGTLSPDEQLFSWYANFGTSDTDNGGMDMGGYWILGEAFDITEYVPEGPVPIPEPGTILLFGSLLTSVFGILKKDLI